MSTGPRFEVWLDSLAGTATESADQALGRVFGIPPDAARELLAALPRVVKRDADAGLAARIVAALEAIGGRAQARPASGAGGLAAASVAAGPHAGQPSTASTLKLGTQDLHLLLPGTWSRPVAEPVTAPVSIAPATARADALELAAQPLHPIEARKRAPERVSLLAPQLFGAAGGPPTPSVTPVRVSHAPQGHGQPPQIDPAVEPALEVVAPAGWQNPLQLPGPDQPARPALRLRPPAERAPDPQRRSAPPAVRSRARPAAPSLLQPLKLALSIWENAERSSWTSALKDHPVAGFLLVLGGCSGAFLLLIAAL